MKKIFDFNKKRKFPPFPDLMLPDYFGVQKSFYVPGYVIQNKDLGKIHQAALLGDVFKVQYLLLLGKNGVNDVDRKKRTCLHLACANGHPDVVSLLIERKCDLNLLDTDHRTPFMKAIQCEDEECATILLQHGADPNIGDGSNNALHYVSYFLGIDLAAKLLHYKADIEAKNKEGLTPLFFAVRGKNCEMAEFLLKNGANVNALDGSKRTTLMVAVHMQSTEMVTLLLKYNVDHTIKDATGKTAEEYAKIHDFPLDFYVKQTEKHMECNKPCTSQISCSEKATVVPEFVLKASSLNEKVAEKSTTKDSLSRLSEKTRPDDPCPSTMDELNFEMEKLPKLKLTKTINAVQHMTKIKHMDNIVYTKVTPFYEDSETLSDIEFLTDASPEPSLKKSTLLDFLNKYGEEFKQQLDAVSSRNRRMESMNRHLQEEAIENLKQKYDRLDLKHHLEIPNHSQ